MVEDKIIEGSLLFRDGKKWKRRWAVLSKLSPVADILQLQLYRDSREKVRGAATKASLALVDLLAVTAGFCLDKENHTLGLLCKDLALIVAFDSQDQLYLWNSKISFTLGYEQQFLVQMIQVPLKSPVSLGPCRIHIRDYRFSLTSGTPLKLVAVWSLIDLRRYGVANGRLVWEGGSKSGNGSGLHVALTDTPNEISRTFDFASAGAIKELTNQGSSRCNSTTGSSSSGSFTGDESGLITYDSPRLFHHYQILSDCHQPRQSSNDQNSKPIKKPFNPMANYDIPKPNYMHYDFPRKFSLSNRLDGEQVKTVKINGEGRMPVLDANTGTLVKGQSFNLYHGHDAKSNFSDYCHKLDQLKDYDKIQKFKETDTIIGNSKSHTELIKPIADLSIPNPEDNEVKASNISRMRHQCYCSIKENNKLTTDERLSIQCRSGSSKCFSINSCSKRTIDGNYLLMNHGPSDCEQTDPYYICMSPGDPLNTLENNGQVIWGDQGRSSSLVRNSCLNPWSLKRSSSADSILREERDYSRYSSRKSSPIDTPPSSPLRCSILKTNLGPTRSSRLRRPSRSQDSYT